MSADRSTFDTIALEFEGPLAWITLNRPEAMNSVSPPEKPPSAYSTPPPPIAAPIGNWPW